MFFVELLRQFIYSKGVHWLRKMEGEADSGPRRLVIR